MTERQCLNEWHSYECSSCLARDPYLEGRDALLNTLPAAPTRPDPLVEAGYPWDDSLLPAAPTIDSAWKRVTEALPEGWKITRLNLIGAPSLRDPFWQVMAERFGGPGAASGEGPTPAAALDALADALLHRGETVG